MTSYPILIERFTANQALTVVCETCHAETIINADELLNEGLYACPDGCPGTAVMKYDEAERCAGCGTLGYWADVLDGCCSRRCQFQAEYAQSLKEHAR